jgi:3-phosphoshikimate 1-carboxyvinyltransferase
MKVKVYPARSIEGSVNAPPSKSYTHRALFTALLTNGESKILNMLNARDTKASIRAVRAFGGLVKGNIVRGVEKLEEPGNIINCGDSGTTIRFAASVASLIDGLTILTGSKSLRRRPMKPLEDALKQLGVQVFSRGGNPPLAIIGGNIKSLELEIVGSVSSQFISGLLIISPLLGLTIHVIGKVVSRPYIDMTIQTMKAFGVRVKEENSTFIIEKQQYKPTTFTVPGDYSSASFLMAVASLLGHVKISNLKQNDIQADKAIVDILKKMGAKVTVSSDYIEVEKGSLEGIEVDCSNTPDIVPVISVLGAYARNETIIRGIAHLRLKESDRIKTISKNLKLMGANVEEGTDYIKIKGGKRLRGAILNSFGDHRIAMAFIVAALAAETPSIIKGVEKIADSYPSFIDHIKLLGGRVEVM